MASTWVKKTIRKMTHRKGFEHWLMKRGDCGHTSGYMAYCEITHKERWIKGIDSYPWSFRP
jgi:hypothetical protein